MDRNTTCRCWVRSFRGESRSFVVAKDRMRHAVRDKTMSVEQSGYRQLPVRIYVVDDTLGCEGFKHYSVANTLPLIAVSFPAGWLIGAILTIVCYKKMNFSKHRLVSESERAS